LVLAVALDLGLVFLEVHSNSCNQRNFQFFNDPFVRKV
jgi:hypothetical protein